MLAVKKVQDLSGIITAWFDTTNAGLKHEPGSYEKITRELNVGLSLPAGYVRH